jgi:hypothetical protein
MDTTYTFDEKEDDENPYAKIDHTSEDAIILFTYIIPQLSYHIHVLSYTVVARRLVFHTQYKKSAAV